MKICETGIVESVSMLSPMIYDLAVTTNLKNYAVPGQFVMIYPKDKSTLLPRPISICEITETGLRFVFRIAGKGTAEFSGYKAGDSIKLMGPLGNGYDINLLKGKKVLTLGGGIGVPPMLELTKALKSQNIDVTAVLGYRDSSLFLKDDFDKYNDTVVATEDGSIGTKGNVMDAIAANNLKADVICACGPMPMLRAIKAYAEKENITAFISLEERMACGVGACLGCVAKTTKEDHHSHVNNARVCTEGPIFDSKEVDI